MLVTVVLLHFSIPPGDGMPKSSKHLQIKANANTKKTGKARDALYTIQRLGPGDKLGEA